MGRKSKREMAPEKRELLRQLVDTYQVESAQDLQEALKDLLGETLQTMLEQELEDQMQESKAQDSSYKDSRNGYKDKTLRSSMGAIPIRVP